jgi:hypothetical protein
MSLVQRAKMHAALAALGATTLDTETHVAVRRLAEADGMLVAEELAPTIVQTAGSSAAERILERGIERYMDDRILTLRKDGVQQHEIGAYGLAYMIAVMDRMLEIGAEIDQKAVRTPSGLPAISPPC